MTLPTTPLPARATRLLDTWFGPQGDPEREQRRTIWFKSTLAFDALLRDRFADDYAMAADGALAAWENRPETALALVLLLDQIPRNIFRGTPRAFATDAVALATAARALARGDDGAVPPAWRIFFYLPFEHSEAIADQHRGVALFAAFPSTPDWPEPTRMAERHRDVIARFGRFPHRNAILSRDSTAEELAFLQEPGSSF